MHDFCKKFEYEIAISRVLVRDEQICKHICEQLGLDDCEYVRKLVREVQGDCSVTGLPIVFVHVPLLRQSLSRQNGAEKICSNVIYEKKSKDVVEKLCLSVEVPEVLHGTYLVLPFVSKEESERVVSLVLNVLSEYVRGLMTS